MRKWLQMREMCAFGEFLLDPSIPLLTYQGTPVNLTPKVLQTLLVLVVHRDRVVSKEEFHEVLWPGLFVDENALAQNIYLLRRALKDRSPGHDYIENAPRLGYRFSGEVRTVQPRRPRLPIYAAAVILCILSAVVVVQSR